MYPRLLVNLEKIKENTEIVLEICKKHGIEILAITKGFCADPQIVEVMIQAGIKTIGDSRILNLKKLESYNVVKVLIRIPMLSEVEDVVKYCNVSYNTEIKTIKGLSLAAQKNGKRHKIIIMIDKGDLREGVYSLIELEEIIQETLRLKNIDIVGFGINMKCFGAIIPTEKTLEELTVTTKQLADKYKLNVNTLSGGNSSSFYLIETERFHGINNIRLGEALILGTEASFNKIIPGCYNDAFTLEAEVIEVKEKPSIPHGKLALNAFNKVPSFDDRGNIKRMICAIGSQDIDFDFIIPKDESLRILGGSSDHFILDCTLADVDYKVGDIVSFTLGYMSILRVMNSPYVEKVFLNSKF